MSVERYKIVVQGPAPGHSPDMVKKQVAALFGGNMKKAEAVLSGKPVVVKRDLDKTSAAKYKNAFEKAGAAVKVFVDKEGGKAKPQTGPQGPAMQCPKCGAAQPKGDSCIKCGIVFAKYERENSEAAGDEGEPAGEGPPPPPVNEALARAQAEYRTRTGGAGGEGVPAATPMGAAVAAIAAVSNQDDTEKRINRDPVNFFGELPKAITYPFRGNGLFVIIGGAVIFTFASYIPFIGFIARLIISAYLASYMFTIVNSTANGEEDPPHWPDFSDIGPALVKYIWVSLVCFAPAGLYMYFVAGFLAFTDPFFYLLVLLGATYWPMALLAVAMSGNFLALNPIVVIPAIIRMPVDYLICLIAFVLVLGTNLFFQEVLRLPIILIGPAIQYFLTIYFSMVQMRILGLLYLAHEDDLDWYQ